MKSKNIQWIIRILLVPIRMIFAQNTNEEIQNKDDNPYLPNNETKHIGNTGLENIKNKPSYTQIPLELEKDLIQWYVNNTDIQRENLAIVKRDMLSDTLFPNGLGNENSMPGTVMSGSSLVGINSAKQGSSISYFSNQKYVPVYFGGLDWNF